MEEIVRQFKGDYRYLSNFYHSPFEDLKGNFYRTVEHFYQSHKSSKKRVQKWIRDSITPGEAKRRGKKVTLREDWNFKREEVMMEGLKLKFNTYPELKRRLVSTGDIELQEGNYWGDDYWGVDLKVNEGKNRLGELLMELREELKNEKSIFQLYFLKT